MNLLDYLIQNYWNNCILSWQSNQSPKHEEVYKIKRKTPNKVKQIYQHAIRPPKNRFSPLIFDAVLILAVAMEQDANVVLKTSGQNEFFFREWFITFLNGCQNVIPEGVIFGIWNTTQKSIGHKQRIKDSFWPTHAVTPTTFVEKIRNCHYLAMRKSN